VRSEEFPDRREGVITGKMIMNELRRPDGTIERVGVSSYSVKVGADSSEDLTVDHKNVSRDRRSFTKHGLRSFLKNSITRDRWEGAPWVVKEHLSKRYGIDTTVPEELRQEIVQAGRKATQAMKKQEDGIKKFFKLGSKDETMARNLATQAGCRKHAAGHFQYQVSQPFNNGVPLQRMPPGAVKYPIDDLETAPKRNIMSRPPFKVLESLENGILGKSVGSLLEIWTTLNVHAGFLVVDTFTFDDFMEAMSFTSEDVECELLIEIHCAILKMLLTEQGTITANIPSLPDESSEEGDSSVAVSTESTPAPEGVNGSNRQKSNLGKYSVSVDDIPHVNGNGNSVNLSHQVADFLEDYDWTEQLEKQEFKAGGWQCIIVGLLERMSLLPYLKEKCDTILAYLAPMGKKPSRDSIRHNYAKMDINLRAAALETVMRVAITTDKMKKYNEERNENMTELRKQKMEFQKQRKP